MKLSLMPSFVVKKNGGGGLILQKSKQQQNKKRSHGREWIDVKKKKKTYLLKFDKFENDRPQTLQKLAIFVHIYISTPVYKKKPINVISQSHQYHHHQDRVFGVHKINHQIIEKISNSIIIITHSPSEK